MGQAQALPCHIQQVLESNVGNSLLADLSIDHSLMKFSFPDSNMVLERSFNEKLADADRRGQVPAYIRSLATAVGPFTKVPNAVGLGAFILSFFLEMFVPAGGTKDTVEMLQRVFNDEKSYAIRDTMDNYLQRTATHISYPAAWHMEEARKTAEKLSLQLRSLYNVMMRGEMRGRYLKQWANGAAFHVLLHAHMANIKHTNGMDSSEDPRSVAHSTVNLYLYTSLPALLDAYKQYKISTTRMNFVPKSRYLPQYCFIADDEINKQVTLPCKEIMDYGGSCRRCKKSQFFCYTSRIPDYINEYMERLFSGPQMSGLTTYFTDLSSNLNELMTRRGEFHMSCTDIRRTYPYVQCG